MINCVASALAIIIASDRTWIDDNKNTELIKTESIQKYEKQQFDDVIITTAGVHFSSQFRDDSHFWELCSYILMYIIILYIILTKYIIIVVD